MRTGAMMSLGRDACTCESPVCPRVHPSRQSQADRSPMVRPNRGSPAAARQARASTAMVHGFVRQLSRPT
jgi:hypothetical protein